MVPSQCELAVEQTLVHIASLQLWCAYISRSIRPKAAKAGSIPEEQIWHVHQQQGGRSQGWFKRRVSLCEFMWGKGFCTAFTLVFVCLLQALWMCILYVCVCVCMWTLYASITPGTLVHCHALFHCQWPPYMAPLSSTLFLIQNKWSQDSTGRRWEGWREGFGGLTKKKKEEKESRALSPWPSIRSLEKKRERERKKRRSMGKFIFPSATINLWPKEIHNN